MDDSQFRRVLDYFSLSWKGYRRVRKGVKKRLARYMQDLALREMEAFLSALDKDPGQRAEVERLLSVSISRFFRDRELWRAMGESVLPEIVSAKPPKVKVWSAGCARGEEVYSFRILWEEWKKDMDRPPELELWATDLNPEYLSQAQKGIYSSASLKEVPEEWRKNYFSPVEGNRWGVADSLKAGIRWRVHHLVCHVPPMKDFQVIFLRNNLLTYYQDETKKYALAKIIQVLSSHGFLLIGSHEKIPKSFSGVEPTLHHTAIYQKNGELEMKAKPKNILITGPPRCGKSTLIEKLIPQIEKPLTGFFTREMREGGKRVGFSIITLDGKEGVLGHKDIKSRVRVGKYGIDLEAIDRIAVPSMIPSKPEQIVIIDEVGKMECFSSLFRETLNQALDSPNTVIGSIAFKGNPFIERIKKRPDVLLVMVDEKNRDSLADSLSRQISFL